MECLQIDWKNIDGTFEKDDFYESIQAPKWIDFTAPLQPADDHAWFCGKAGCTHETKSVLQELNKGNANPSETSMKSLMDPLTAKTLSAGVATKKTRPVVSSSLSSLSDIKAAYAKNKVLHHMQMPSIKESKGDAPKNNRRQQASENENPNRACKVQDGACKKLMQRALEGVTRHSKMSESNGIFGKEESAHVPNRDASFHSFKTFSEQVSLSQTGPIMEVSKSVFIFGNRDPMHVKSSLNKAGVKESPSNSNSMTEAKIKKAGGIRFFSRPSPTARNAHLSASLTMPIVRRSAANAKPLHGIHLGNDKVVECKPPRITRDTRVTVQVHACRKNNEHKKQAHVGKLQERDPLKDRDLKKNHTSLLSKKQQPHPPQLDRNDRLEIGSKDSVVLAHTASREEQHTQRESKWESIVDTDSSAAPIVQGQGNLQVDKNDLLPLSSCVKDVVEGSNTNNIEEERKLADIQTRDEDSITNTLEKFLENLQITSHDDELVSNEEDCEPRKNFPCTDCVTEKIQSKVISAKEQEKADTHHKECAIEQDSIQTHQYVDDDALKHEAVTFNHAECATEGNSVQPHSEVNALEHDLKDGGVEKVARRSHHSAECLQMSDPLSCKDESNPSSAVSHVISYGVSAKDEVLLTENDKRPKKTQQKHNVEFRNEWQKCRGTKRKSSELNLNCSSKDHKHGTQKLKQSSSTAKLPVVTASQPHGLQNSCEEHRKKLKIDVMQAFKPFRFRTEERGALKELGLGKKESGIPKLKNMVHHALQMPSFGRPFRPQRSTKKLTIPREPKFHVSRTKNTCTSLATGLASS